MGPTGKLLLVVCLGVKQSEGGDTDELEEEENREDDEQQQQEDEEMDEDDAQEDDAEVEEVVEEKRGGGGGGGRRRRGGGDDEEGQEEQEEQEETCQAPLGTMPRLHTPACIMQSHLTVVCLCAVGFFSTAPTADRAGHRQPAALHGSRRRQQRVAVVVLALLAAHAAQQTQALRRVRVQRRLRQLTLARGFRRRVDARIRCQQQQEAPASA